jgi:hypothetical protein
VASGGDQQRPGRTMTFSDGCRSPSLTISNPVHGRQLNPRPNDRPTPVQTTCWTPCARPGNATATGPMLPNDAPMLPNEGQMRRQSGPMLPMLTAGRQTIVDQTMAMLTDANARSDTERARADPLRDSLDVSQADLAAARNQAREAQEAIRTAQDALEALRAAGAERKARGLRARLREVWRGE